MLWLVSTTDTSIGIVRFCPMDTLEMCGEILQPGGQLVTQSLLLDAWNG